ncbi:hypothetical protein GINT2_001730 [Glugoides intestinalis]
MKMHCCVYTTQKTKKAKKWIDGFITLLKSSVILYNEDKKEIHRAQFKIREDGLVETTGYLIYLDSEDSFFNDGNLEEEITPANPDTTPSKTSKPDTTSTPVKPDTNSFNPIVDVNSQDKPLTGRSSGDILGLFK